MTTDSLFFRVEHDLLRSESFKQLGGSAIKVYLILGMYADFDTGWAYPSIRTIARQAGLSRQTVLDAIEELSRNGVVATQKAQGRPTAYKLIRNQPERPRTRKTEQRPDTGPVFLGAGWQSVPDSSGVTPATVLGSLGVAAQFLGVSGPAAGPKQEPRPRQDTASSPSIPIPGTPFRINAAGQLLVVADVQTLLGEFGLPQALAKRLAEREPAEQIARVVLNALYLKGVGKLQNAAGYLKAGIEERYELLPQVASKLESRRRELLAEIEQAERKRREQREREERAAEEAAINLVLQSLGQQRLGELVEAAVKLLPTPLTRRNPTLSNPFVRSKVYELASGELPLEE